MAPLPQRGIGYGVWGIGYEVYRFFCGVRTGVPGTGYGSPAQIRVRTGYWVQSKSKEKKGICKQIKNFFLLVLILFLLFHYYFFFFSIF